MPYSSSSRMKQRPKRVFKKRSNRYNAVATISSAPITRLIRQKKQDLQLTNTPGGNGQAFQLSDLPGYSEFGYLFDEYRIDKISVTVFFSKDTATVAGSTWNASELPMIYMAYDPDDSAAPSTAEELLEYSNCKVARMDKPFTFTFEPSVLGAVYQTAIANGYGPIGKAWIDIGSSGTKHYGLKWWYEPFNQGLGVSAPLGTVTFLWKYWLSFKGIH